MKAKLKEIKNYDAQDTSYFINKKNKKSLADIGFSLPKEPSSKVISIRLPTGLLNVIQAYSTENDLPYESVIKLFLQEEVKKKKLG
jgi:predicted DNA binding CopG/RHH family protein